MTSHEVYISLKILFEELNHYSSVRQLEELIVRQGLGNNVDVFYTKYPKFNFTIFPSEVQKLIDDKIFDKDHNLNIERFEGTTLERLLVAILWKNAGITYI